MELTATARVKRWYVGNVSQNYCATHSFSLSPGVATAAAAFVLFCWLILIVYAKQL